jgi:hypothetical protein
MPRLRLALVAWIAGFVVVIGVVAGFVVMTATSGDDAVVAVNPAVPTITDAGGPESEQAPVPPPPLGTESITPPASSRQAVVTPRPKPKPPRPKRKPIHASPRKPVGRGHDRISRPWDKCSPEGAHAFTSGHIYPLVCQDGRWQIEPFR